MPTAQLGIAGGREVGNRRGMRGGSESDGEDAESAGLERDALDSPVEIPAYA